MQKQCTVKKTMSTWGIEPLGGKPVKVTINKAPPNTGRVFINQGDYIPSTLDYVEPIGILARLLSLRKEDKRILMPEHLIGELYGYGIDNVFIELESQDCFTSKFLKHLPFGSAKNAKVVPYLGRKICDGLENNIEEQEALRKILGLEEKIETEKLTFTPLKGSDDLIIKVTIDYKLTKSERIIQEKELTVSPKSIKDIAMTRAYCNTPMWAPKWLTKLVGYSLFLSHGLGYGMDESTQFFPRRSIESWEGYELIEKEVLYHSILDKLGEFSLLPGKLAGLHIDCKFAGHKYTIETLKKHAHKFHVE